MPAHPNVAKGATFRVGHRLLDTCSFAGARQTFKTVDSSLRIRRRLRFRKVDSSGDLAWAPIGAGLDELSHRGSEFGHRRKACWTCGAARWGVFWSAFGLVAWDDGRFARGGGSDGRHGRESAMLCIGQKA